MIEWLTYSISVCYGMVSLGFAGAIVNTLAEKNFTARALIDDTQEYSLTAKLPTEGRDDSTRYEPSLVIVIPERRDVRLEGDVVVKQGRKYDVDLRLRNLFQQPIRVKGTLRIIC